VIETTNYFPARDGNVPEIDEGIITSSELIAKHLSHSRVVKAFNTILSTDLAGDAQPSGATGRRAVPIASDDNAAKEIVSKFIQSIGFDVVDVGGLAQGRRLEFGTPVFGAKLDAKSLRSTLNLS
jgi:predicted dinucleotide-binding enzyme